MEYPHNFIPDIKQIEFKNEENTDHYVDSAHYTRQLYVIHEQQHSISLEMEGNCCCEGSFNWLLENSQQISDLLLVA